jgi:hypothetical protein
LKIIHHKFVVSDSGLWYNNPLIFLLSTLTNEGKKTVSKPHSRTPKNYDGTEITGHHIHDLLPNVLSKIGKVYEQRADLILALWPTLIGPKLAAMTQAVSFSEGVLVVKVKNSTPYSLLSQNDKPRLISQLRQKFPRVEIKTILFRIG